MKRFRQFRSSAAAAVLAATAMVTSIGQPAARAAETELAQQFTAKLHGDVTTVGAALPGCDTSQDCPESATAALELPSGARVAYARLLWASGLGENCRAGTVPVRPRLGVTRAGGGTDWTTVAGQATGKHTAEAETTETLTGSRPVSVAVAGLRGDGCAAGWSLAIVYTAPGADQRHIALHTGASDGGVTIDGFRRHGEARARLTATAYGGGETQVNGTAIDGAGGSHVTDTTVPRGAIDAGDTSARIGFGEGALVQQVALSVPVAAVGITAVATPAEIGPGSRVVHTITVTNNTGGTATGLRLRVDLRRALDDATAPAGITASTGTAGFDGTRLTWHGDLPPGGTATVSYAVTVKNPRPGDGRLEATVVAGPASDCPAGEPGPGCVIALRFPSRPHTDDAGAARAPGARLPVTGTALAAPAALGLAALGLGTALLLTGPAARRPARRH